MYKLKQAIPISCLCTVPAIFHSAYCRMRNINSLHNSKIICLSTDPTSVFASTEFTLIDLYPSTTSVIAITIPIAIDNNNNTQVTT